MKAWLSSISACPSFLSLPWLVRPVKRSTALWAGVFRLLSGAGGEVSAYVDEVKVVDMALLSRVRAIKATGFAGTVPEAARPGRVSGLSRASPGQCSQVPASPPAAPGLRRWPGARSPAAGRTAGARQGDRRHAARHQPFLAGFRQVPFRDFAGSRGAVQRQHAALLGQARLLGILRALAGPPGRVS